MEGRNYERGAAPTEDTFKDDPKLRARTSMYFGRFQSEVRVRDKDVITPAQAVRRPFGVLLSKELWQAAEKNVRMAYFLLRDDDDTLLWITKRSKNNVVTYREPAEPGKYTLYIYRYAEGRRFHSPRTRRSFDLKRYAADHDLHLMDRVRFKVSAAAAYGQAAPPPPPVRDRKRVRRPREAIDEPPRIHREEGEREAGPAFDFDDRDRSSSSPSPSPSRLRPERVQRLAGRPSPPRGRFADDESPSPPPPPPRTRPERTRRSAGRPSPPRDRFAESEEARRGGDDDESTSQKLLALALERAR